MLPSRPSRFLSRSSRLLLALLGSAVCVSTPAAVAQARVDAPGNAVGSAGVVLFPDIPPEQVAADTTSVLIDGRSLLAAPSFDPFESFEAFAGRANLREAIPPSQGGEVDRLTGEPIRVPGVVLDVAAIYTGASDDPLDLRGFERAVFPSGEPVRSVRYNSRVLECSSRVTDVVYRDDYYRGVTHGLIGGVLMAYPRYRGHRRFGFDYGRVYGRHFGGGRFGSRGIGGRFGGYRNGYRDGRRDGSRFEGRERRREADRRGRGIGERGGGGIIRVDDSRVEGGRLEDGRIGGGRQDRRGANGGRAAGRADGRAETGARRGRTDPGVRALVTRERRDEFVRGARERRSQTGSASSGDRPRRAASGPRADSRDGWVYTPRQPRFTNERPERSPRRAAPSRGEPKRSESRRSESRRSEPRRSESRRSQTRRSEPRRIQRSDVSRATDRAFSRGNSKIRRQHDYYPVGTTVERRVDGSCAKEEQLALFIPAERLDAARFDGLTVVLLGRDGSELPVFVPPNYVQGVRLALSGGTSSLLQ